MNLLARMKKIFCLIGYLLLSANLLLAQQLHPAEKNKAVRTVASDFKTSIEFRNESNQTVKVFWLDENGRRNFFITLAPKQSDKIQTYLSQPWLITDERDNAISLYYPDAQPRTIRFQDQDLVGLEPTDEIDEDYDNPNLKYDTKPIKICANQEIPRGYLIIGANSEWGCPNWSAAENNAYTIRRPSLTEPTKICANQKIPRGFVITAAGSEWGCPNWTATGQNMYTITRPKEEQSMCSVSEVPRGFVVTSTYADWGCPNWTATGTNARKIKRVR